MNSFFALVVFCAVAVLSVNCNLALFECGSATGTAGTRADYRLLVGENV
jgi:hypothetical protein